MSNYKIKTIEIRKRLRKCTTFQKIYYHISLKSINKNKFLNGFSTNFQKDNDIFFRYE